MPILKAKGDTFSIIIPPCRGTCSHVAALTQAIAPTPRTKVTYSEELLSNFIGIRNALIKMLVAHGLNHFKVMDCCFTTDCKLAWTYCWSAQGFRQGWSTFYQRWLQTSGKVLLGFSVVVVYRCYQALFYGIYCCCWVPSVVMILSCWIPPTVVRDCCCDGLLLFILNHCGEVVPVTCCC